MKEESSSPKLFQCSVKALSSSTPVKELNDLLAHSFLPPTCWKSSCREKLQSILERFHLAKPVSFLGQGLVVGFLSPDDQCSSQNNSQEEEDELQHSFLSQPLLKTFLTSQPLLFTPTVFSHLNTGWLLSRETPANYGLCSLGVNSSSPALRQRQQTAAAAAAGALIQRRERERPC